MSHTLQEALGTHRTLMHQRIVGFHQDEHADWVVELQCGHQQHVRHKPPWFVRSWVTTEQGRNNALGTPMQCPLCDRPTAAA